MEQVLVQKHSSLLYSNFNSSLYIAYSLSAKNCLIDTVTFVWNEIKSKFTYSGWEIVLNGQRCMTFWQWIC